MTVNNRHHLQADFKNMHNVTVVQNISVLLEKIAQAIMSRSSSNKSVESRSRSRSPRRPEFVLPEMPDKESQTEITFNPVEDRFETFNDPFRAQLVALYDATCDLANLFLSDQDINAPPKQLFCDPHEIFKLPNIQWTQEWTGLKHNDRDNWVFHWAIYPNSQLWYVNIRTKDGSDLWAEYNLVWQAINARDTLHDAFIALRSEFELRTQYGESLMAPSMGIFQ